MRTRTYRSPFRMRQIGAEKAYRAKVKLAAAATIVAGTTLILAKKGAINLPENNSQIFDSAKEFLKKPTDMLSKLFQKEGNNSNFTNKISETLKNIGESIKKFIPKK